MSKVCTKCGVEKEESEFSKTKAVKSGRRARCKECLKLQSRAYYRANLEKVRELSLAYYHANLEKEHERQRAYRQANLEKIRERERAYRRDNSEKIRELTGARRQANREKLRDLARLYRQANREKVRERCRLWRQGNLEKAREYAVARRHAISASYVKSLLGTKNPPQELIDLKRAHIQIQRFIKEKEKNNA